MTVIETQTFTLGDRVEHLCVTCGVERGQIVASLSKRGQVVRISCPVCGSRNPYKRGAVRTGTRVAGQARAPNELPLNYRKDDTLTHPMFGAGEVTMVIEPRKMDVLFEDRLRRLLCGNL